MGNKRRIAIPELGANKFLGVEAMYFDSRVKSINVVFTIWTVDSKGQESTELFNSENKTIRYCVVARKNTKILNEVSSILESISDEEIKEIYLADANKIVARVSNQILSPV